MALNPALALSPGDRREVSFTLGLAPSGNFASSGGSVAATLHYHTSEGRQGTLRLAEPPAEARALARLLGSDIEAAGMIIGANGIQHGLEPDDTTPRFSYHPFVLPSMYLGDSLPDPVPRIPMSADRLAINAAIAAPVVFDRVLDLLTAGDSLAFDLLAALPDRRAADALLALLAAGTHVESAIQAFCIRHMIDPDALLADSVVPAIVRMPTRRFSDRNAATALVFHPQGRWVEALLALSDASKEALVGLYLRREMLTAVEATLRSRAPRCGTYRISSRSMPWFASCSGGSVLHRS